MTSEYDLETKRVMWTNEKGSPSNIPALVIIFMIILILHFVLFQFN